METILEFAASGLGNLAAYLAAHVLLCLMPAFLIASAMTALIPKETITRFLGRDRPKMISYPASATAGFLLAVCSCTVIPLFAGIYKKGAGLGPAITFLFVAPAVNILAISYTGKVIGMDLAIASLVLSIVFGIGIGLIMASIFHKEDLEHDQNTDLMFAGQSSMRRTVFYFLFLLVALLIVGTFQIELLKRVYFQFEFPVKGVEQFQTFLLQLVPFDAAKGEEGVTAQLFLDLGMHRGPLLAYLISDPELSLQSILITASIIGKKKPGYTLALSHFSARWPDCYLAPGSMGPVFG